LSALQRGPARFYRDNVIACDGDTADYMLLSSAVWFAVAKSSKAAPAMSLLFIFPAICLVGAI
jgi:hypothetical protein